MFMCMGIWVCVLVFACPCPCSCQVVRTDSVCLYLFTYRPIYVFVCVYITYVCESVVVFSSVLLPVATCKDRFCIFFCLGLCLLVSLYVRFHRCFFLMNKAEN